MGCPLFINYRLFYLRHLGILPCIASLPACNQSCTESPAQGSVQERKCFPCPSSDPLCSCTRQASIVSFLGIFSHFLSPGCFKHQQVSPRSESPSVALYSCGHLHISSFSLPIVKKASDFISLILSDLSLQFGYPEFALLTVSNFPPWRTYLGSPTGL